VVFYDICVEAIGAVVGAIVGAGGVVQSKLPIGEFRITETWP